MQQNMIHQIQPGFKKTRVFKKKAQPSGFFGFWSFIGFFWTSRKNR